MKKDGWNIEAVLELIAALAAIAAIAITVIKFWKPICAFFRKACAGAAAFIDKFSCPCVCKAVKKPAYTAEELSDFADVEA